MWQPPRCACMWKILTNGCLGCHMLKMLTGLTLRFLQTSECRATAAVSCGLLRCLDSRSQYFWQVNRFTTDLLNLNLKFQIFWLWYLYLWNCFWTMIIVATYFFSLVYPSHWRCCLRHLETNPVSIFLGRSSSSSVSSSPPGEQVTQFENTCSI